MTNFWSLKKMKSFVLLDISALAKRFSVTINPSYNRLAS
jgi:hypothetical protein